MRSSEVILKQQEITNMLKAIITGALAIMGFNQNMSDPCFFAKLDKLERSMTLWKIILSYRDEQLKGNTSYIMNTLLIKIIFPYLDVNLI